MQWEQALRRWRAWQQRHTAIGVDVDEAAVRWVALGCGDRRLIAHGELVEDEAQDPLALRKAWQDQGLWGGRLAMSLASRPAVLSDVQIPRQWGLADRSTWVRALMAQHMGLPIQHICVDWREMSSGHSPEAYTVVGALRQARSSREHWARCRGLDLCVLDVADWAMARCADSGLAGQTDPICVWWLVPHQARLVAAWWYQGRWGDSQDVAFVWGNEQLPPVVLERVFAWMVQSSPNASRAQWWCLGSLACMGSVLQTLADGDGFAWSCQPAPLPWGHGGPWPDKVEDQRFALALGLALHPGLWT